jgi:hypothetical protein
MSDFKIKCGKSSDVYFNDSDEKVLVTVTVQDRCEGPEGFGSPAVIVSGTKGRILPPGGGVVTVKVPPEQHIEVICYGLGEKEGKECTVAIQVR